MTSVSSPGLKGSLNYDATSLFGAMLHTTTSVLNVRYWLPQNAGKSLVKSISCQMKHPYATDYTGPTELDRSQVDGLACCLRQNQNTAQPSYQEPDQWQLEIHVRLLDDLIFVQMRSAMILLKDEEWLIVLIWIWTALCSTLLFCFADETVVGEEGMYKTDEMVRKDCQPPTGR